MTKFAYPHLAARLFNAPLLIAHDKLRAILAAVGGRIVIGGTRAGMDDDEGDGDREVLPPYQMSGSIAIISLTGTLVARGAWIGAYSGLTSYQGLALQIGLALADPQVTGILLDIVRLLFILRAPAGCVQDQADLWFDQ
jgi:ClpP class serine protease